MNILLLFAFLFVQLITAQQRYVDGLRKKSGSYECPNGYHSVQDIKICKTIALGKCLSKNSAECRIWSQYARRSDFASDHSTSNQPGCYYDEGHGVLFNTNKNWNGKINEANDRPICQINMFKPLSGLYSDGIRQPKGSISCPSGYVPLQDKEECRKVAKGKCLSSVGAECDLWSKWADSNTFAKDQGVDNQPGCYYDQDHGVLFNTNNKWSGKFNENNDRPICKFRSGDQYGFVRNGTCEDHGLHSIFTPTQCKAAAADFSATKTYPVTNSKFTYYFRAGDEGGGRPLGCSYNRGNVELFEKSSGNCNVHGFWGCFCLKDDLYVDGVRKPSGSNSCPIYYLPILDVEECKAVARGPCLSNLTNECKIWSKWVNTNTFAKDQGVDNQPGCYYDQDHGVLFNTNNKWSGKFNEKNDRPICKKDPENFSESKIVRMLRQLIAEGQKEISTINIDVAEAEKKVKAAIAELEIAQGNEALAKLALEKAKKAESAALGRLEALKKEYNDTAPDLINEIGIFESVLKKLTEMSEGTNLIEKAPVMQPFGVSSSGRVASLLSTLEKVDPAQLKKVSDMINVLLQDAKDQLRKLEGNVSSATVAHKKAVTASAEAFGDWTTANAEYESKGVAVNKAAGARDAAKQHASDRIPVIRGEIANLEQAILLVKSLED